MSVIKYKTKYSSIIPGIFGEVFFTITGIKVVALPNLGTKIEF